MSVEEEYLEYQDVVAAGVAFVAASTGRVLLTRRAFDETDAESAREMWEFPGGHRGQAETPITAAMREFVEETGLEIPDGEVADWWGYGKTTDDNTYQGFVYVIPDEIDLTGWSPTLEVSEIGWFDATAVAELEAEGLLRGEIVATMNWDLIFKVSRNEEDMSQPVEASDTAGPILVHGVLAPEGVESGDSRGFSEGALTRRPTRLPFGWQKFTADGHKQSVTIGSIDAVMRKDGMIHWEGSLIAELDETQEFLKLLAHFGQYGVSIDGDRSELDMDKSLEVEGAWFAGARISGAVACSIPAFAEAYVALGAHPDMTAPEDSTPSEGAPEWETVLVSSATGTRVYPPREYFEEPEYSGALRIEKPDADGLRRVHGFVGQWGVCHIGYENCVPLPHDSTGGYRGYQLGETELNDGSTISTGVITYNTVHRTARKILTESSSAIHAENIKNAWAAVRVGENAEGVWFSGVVLNSVPEDDIELIRASGQVSGEWRKGVMISLLAVNTPGFPVVRASAEFDGDEVVALAAGGFVPEDCEHCATTASADPETAAGTQTVDPAGPTDQTGDAALIAEITSEVEQRMATNRRFRDVRSAYMDERIADLRSTLGGL